MDFDNAIVFHNGTQRDYDNDTYRNNTATIFYNDTHFDNYNTTDSNNSEKFGLTEYLLKVYESIILLLIIPSVICSAIHICKFFRSASPQSLANKNLSFYCVFLMIHNILNAGRTTLSYDSNYFGIINYKNYLHLLAYFSSATAFFKFIIALDLCLCFRKIALHLQRPSGSQRVKFAIYCILGICLPCLHTTVLSSKIDGLEPLRTFTVIRIARMIPIFGAFWYITLASIDKKELWSKFSLHLRLLIMIGGFSSIISVIEIIMRMIINPNISIEARLDDGVIIVGSFLLNSVLASLEAFAIAIFITFKKNSFKPVIP